MKRKLFGATALLVTFVACSDRSSTTPSPRTGETESGSTNSETGTSGLGRPSTTTSPDTGLQSGQPSGSTGGTTGTTGNGTSGSKGAGGTSTGTGTGSSGTHDGR